MDIREEEDLNCVEGHGKGCNRGLGLGQDAGIGQEEV